MGFGSRLPRTGVTYVGSCADHFSRGLRGVDCQYRPSIQEELSGGCQHRIRGVATVIRPETSRLSCVAIHKLIFGIPSEPQSYLIMGEAPHLLWKCRFYGVKSGPVLLQCQHHERRFSIDKVPT